MAKSKPTPTKPKRLVVLLDHELYARIERAAERSRPPYIKQRMVGPWVRAACEEKLARETPNPTV